MRLYHPLFPALWYQPYRDHRKILAVDRRVAFTGGMNIGEEYGSSFGPPTQGDHVARHARAPRGPRGVGDGRRLPRGLGAARAARAFEIPPLALPPDGAPPAAGASILVLDSAPGRGHEETASVLAATIAASRARFWLTNAYFAPRRGALPLLADAARRGVDVRLLLPGVSDVPLVRHAGHGSYRHLLKRGVRIFEYAAVRPAREVDRRGRVRLDGGLDEHGLPVVPLQRGVQRRRPRRRRRARSSRTGSRPTSQRRPRSRSRNGTAARASTRPGDALARMLSPVL